MKKIYPLIIFLGLIVNHNISNAQNLIIDVSNDIVNPKHYIVTKTNNKIVIDGIADEASWKSSVFTDYFIDIEGIKTPKYDTKVKMLWDDNFLYVYAEMEEPHIWGNLTQRDAVIFYNNDFEVFIDPSASARRYGEVEINALGTVWDLFLDKPYRVFGKAVSDWNLNDLKSAVKHYGTVNNPEDIDSLWTVELAIPMKSLIIFKGNKKSLPSEGEKWRINFSRVQWDYDLINGKYQRKKDNGKYREEYNWVWSNQKVINMHEPEKWGVMQFTNKTSSKNVLFIEDKDMQLKQVAYALFRHIRFGSLRNLMKKEVCYRCNIEAKVSLGESFDASFYKTNFGFELKTKSKKTNKIYIINEEGVLKRF